MNIFNKGIGILLLRILIGFRLIYGVLDNVFSWERMLEFEQFLVSQNFPWPLASAIVSVYAQFICGILFLVGWKIRIAAIVMIVNFFIASLVQFHQGFEAMTAPLLILFSSVLFLLEGSGAFSIESQSETNRLK